MTENLAFDLWLEFEAVDGLQAVPEFDHNDDFFNMTISLPDGRTYALNVWTYQFLERARRQAQESGEELGGAYLLPPDLFVEKLDRQLLEAIVSDLLHRRYLRDEWLVRECDDT